MFLLLFRCLENYVFMSLGTLFSKTNEDRLLKFLPHTYMSLLNMANLNIVILKQLIKIYTKT